MKKKRVGKNWRDMNASERRRHRAKDERELAYQVMLLGRALRYHVKKLKKKGEWGPPE